MSSIIAHGFQRPWVTSKGHVCYDKELSVATMCVCLSVCLSVYLGSAECVVSSHVSAISPSTTTQTVSQYRV